VIEPFKKAREATKIPGPGKYPILQLTTKSGVYTISKYKSTQCRRFGQEPKGIKERGTFVQTPGPGTYRTPSEFGIYRASEKFIKETERSELRKTSPNISKLKEKMNKTTIM